MVRVLIKSIKSKRAIISVTLLAAFAAVFAYDQMLDSRLLSMQNLNDGIQTCFTRVNQTYTAKMIGQERGNYLSSDFMMTSEECMGEALSVAEEIFSDVSSFTIKQLNKLVSDVHWFHEKIEGKGGIFGMPKKSDSDISTRFEKIEGVKDILLENTESIINKIHRSQIALRWTMALLGLFALFFFLWEVQEQRNRIIRNRNIERDAEIELRVDGVPQSSRVEQVLSEAFEVNELENCSALFKKYHSAILDGQMAYFVARDYHEDKQLAENIEITAEKSVGNRVEVEEDQENLLDMANVLTQVVEHISSAVFHKGILFELSVDDNILFGNDRDILEQIFFHALNYSISACEETASKKINVSLRRLGGTAIFEIEDSGIGFDPEMIKHELGLQGADLQLPLELQIVKEIVAENNGELSFENILSDDGLVVGGKIRVIFRLQQNREFRRGLVQIRKTTKKELLKEMRAQETTV